MNKKGMTLLELMVYIALAALLLAPVIMLMHNSSLNMARDAKALDLRVSGRDVLNIMYGDIINTGFKITNFSTLSTDTLAVYRRTSSTAPALYDSSSF
jgi:prepilin-type N-terminal cleavage/methylation domain-containing protein